VKIFFTIFRVKMRRIFLQLGLALAESVQGTVLTGDKGFARAKSLAAVVLFRERAFHDGRAVPTALPKTGRRVEKHVINAMRLNIL
jgi:hypothetical protein